MGTVKFIGCFHSSPTHNNSKMSLSQFCTFAIENRNSKRKYKEISIVEMEAEEFDWTDAEWKSCEKCRRQMHISSIYFIKQTDYFGVDHIYCKLCVEHFNNKRECQVMHCKFCPKQTDHCPVCDQDVPEEGFFQHRRKCRSLEQYCDKCMQYRPEQFVKRYTDSYGQECWRCMWCIDNSP